MFPCLLLSVVAMARLAAIHGTRTAVTTTFLACDLLINMVDKNGSHNSEDDIYNDFLHVVNS
jgi:hypothetical protein